MKVKELIEQLEKLDPELPVGIIEYSHFVGLRLLEVGSIKLDDSLTWDYLDYDPIKGKYVRIKYG